MADPVAESMGLGGDPATLGEGRAELLPLGDREHRAAADECPRQAVGLPGAVADRDVDRDPLHVGELREGRLHTLEQPRLAEAAVDEHDGDPAALAPVDPRYELRHALSLTAAARHRVTCLPTPPPSSTVWEEPTGQEALPVQYVNLGNTGLRVSRVCLGMMSFGAHPERAWALPEAEAEPIIRRAVEGGITFFDTADVYNGGESEVVTGRVLPKLLSREELVIATKVHGRTMPGENGRGLSRKHIMASIDASLQRLGLDYVDLYQIHRWDPLTPIAETMDALHDVVKAGKARYIGASSMFAWQFAKAQAAADRARRDAIRLDAEPLQPRLPRGGAGDDPAVHRPGRRRAAVEPARPRAARPATARARANG